MRKDILLATHTGSLVTITPILLLLPRHLISWTGSPVYLLGSRSGTSNRARKDVARPQLSNRNQLRAQSSINDNYCVSIVLCSAPRPFTRLGAI